jgi:GT2 family glycosyltransferase
MQGSSRGPLDAALLGFANAPYCSSEPGGESMMHIPHRRQTLATDPNRPDLGDVGVVVIGRNEGRRLIRCLESLSGSSATIVYVDSNSTDDSVENALGFGADVVRLDPARPFTAARARNEGMARLVHLVPGVRFVQFVDGDCEVASGWIQVARDHLARDPGVAVVCGRRRERFPNRSIYNKLCDLEWDTPVGVAAACGGDAMMRAEAFLSVGGFSAVLTAGEEPELCARLRGRGWRIRRLADEMTLHDADMKQLRQWWMRSVRGGYGYAQVWRTTRETAEPLYGREVKRALGWTAVPVLALTALPFSIPLAAALAVAPVGQVIRLAVKRGPSSGLSWQWAALTTLSKLPEAQGVVRYLRDLGRPARSAIQYK